MATSKTKKEMEISTLRWILTEMCCETGTDSKVTTELRAKC
jgi:hypothetical protein